MFLQKTDKVAVLTTLKTLGVDVYVRSMSGETRKTVFAATAGSKSATSDVPAEQFCLMASRACAESILGENREPVADQVWWYEQRPDVLRECWELVAAASGLNSASDANAKKNLNGTTKSAPYSESADESDVATQTACEPNLAAVS